MKTFVVSFLSFLKVAFAHAAVHTVSNNPSSPAQYTTIQAACDAASAGDTIYVAGSPNSYSNTVTLRKRLTLIGPGAYPNKQFSLPATLTTSIILDSVLNVSGASGSRIIGFNSISGGFFNVSGSYSSFARPNYISVIRNRNNTSTANLSVLGNNWTISENILYGVNIGNFNFCLIKNNLFIGPVGTIISSNQSSVLIDHNTFISSGGLSGISNALITNNIFQASNPVGSGVTNCVFNNNLTYLNTNNNLPTGTNNTGAGNIINQNPLFVNVPVFTTFNNTYNYRLQDTSPGNNAGTDGTDLGAFGGSTPMLDLSGMSDLPYVREMNIQNSTIGIGTNLDVQVKARKR